ncbi:MAG TPA: hypothetical protein VGJ84_09975 [Polyangiaceae bacterium]
MSRVFTTALAIAVLTLSIGCVSKLRSGGGRSSSDRAHQCPPVEWPLLPVQADQGLVRLYVEVELEGRPALLLLDTGADSSLSDSLQGLRQGNGRLKVAGCALGLPYHANDVLDRPYHGRDIMGLLGFNMFEHEAALIDVDAKKMIFFGAGAPELAGPDWVRIPLEVARHRAVIEAKIGGAEVRLMLDTGSPTAVLIDPNVDLRSGQAYTGADVFSNALRGVLSTQTLELGARAPRQIAVFRARSWPALTQLPPGMNVAGVLGLSSLQSKKFVLDFPNSQLWLERE